MNGWEAVVKNVYTESNLNHRLFEEDSHIYNNARCDVTWDLLRNKAVFGILTLAVVKRICSKISGAFYRSITIVYMIGLSFSFLNEIIDPRLI